MGWGGGGVNQASGGVFYLARFLSQDFNCFYATTVKMIIAVCVFVLYETSFHKFEIHLGIGPDQPHRPQPLRCLAKLASPVPLPLRSSLSNAFFIVSYFQSSTIPRVGVVISEVFLVITRNRFRGIVPSVIMMAMRYHCSGRFFRRVRISIRTAVNQSFRAIRIIRLNFFCHALYSSLYCSGHRPIAWAPACFFVALVLFLPAEIFCSIYGRVIVR